MEKNLKDTKEVIEKSIKALNKEDSSLLRDLSNQTIHNSSIYQDRYSLLTAYIIYSISKIVQYQKETQIDNWKKFKQDILNALAGLNKSIDNINQEFFSKKSKEIIKIIDSIDKIQSTRKGSVLEASKIKKGAMLAKHGISLGRISSLLEISEWDLMQYIGHTNLIDTSDKNLLVRLKNTRELFNLK